MTKNILLEVTLYFNSQSWDS